MNIDELCSFYCLNSKVERSESIKESYKKVDISCNFYEGVNKNDPYIVQLEKRYFNCVYCMYGHMNMIHDFYYNTDKQYGIFSEDDIYIHINFKKYLENIIVDFERLNLDVLLLSYLTNFKITEEFIDFKLKNENMRSNENFQYNYHNFPDNLWGSQMYLLSRKHAKFLLDKYYDGIAYTELYDKCEGLPPLSADWTITKDGNRALIFPLLAIEKPCNYEHYGQNYLHNYTYLNFFVENEYV